MTTLAEADVELEKLMATKSAFISFDYDHDNDLRGNLVAQAKESDSPFSITDWSVKEPFDEKWREKVRDIIERTDLTIVICGEHTHQAKGVEAEVTMAQQAGKPYFLLKGRRKKTCTRPQSAPKKKKIHPWTWPTLKALLQIRSRLWLLKSKNLQYTKLRIPMAALSTRTCWSSTKSTYSPPRTSARGGSRQTDLC